MMMLKILIEKNYLLNSDDFHDSEVDLSESSGNRTKFLPIFSTGTSLLQNEGEEEQKDTKRYGDKNIALCQKLFDCQTPAQHKNTLIILI